MNHLSNLVSRIWHWLPEHSTLPLKYLIFIALALGALIAITPASWRISRLFATYIHEAGHAVIALLTGRKVLSIRLEADASGTTKHAGVKGAFFSHFLTTIAGYPAPAVAGYLMILGLSLEHARFVLGAFYLVAVALAFIQHSARGWAVTLLILGACVVLTLVASNIMEMFLFLVAGYLLFASPRTIVELHQVHSQDKRNKDPEREIHSDAQSLAEMTGLGAVIWEIIFLGICLACLYYSFKLIS